MIRNFRQKMELDYQEHAGAVNTGTSLKVQYAWSEMSSGANHSRLNTITYPNGKVLTHNYSSGLNSNISRLTSLSDTSGTLEEYTFLGVDTTVRRAHSQSGVDLTYIKQTGESNGDAGDQYTGLDRFDRIVDQGWIKTSDGTHRDRFQYGYDRNSNRLTRSNLVNSAFNETYSYDSLNQLTSFARGAHTQSWDHDALGNFDAVNTDGTNQTRTHNKQNEITSILGGVTPTYDANGNLTKDETGRTFEYDAWNRLVRAKNSGGTTIAEYKHDGLFRRVSETKSGTTTDFYYSAAWQVLEERISGNAKVQYVWSPVYVDALILRDRDADGNGSLEERLWVVQDANFNVTALVNVTGAVVERYAYDPFGAVSFFTSGWVGLGASAYAWTYTFQGRPYDSVTGTSDFRIRVQSPTLGRMLQNDFLGFGAGDVNFYRLESNGPTTRLDPSGLEDEIYPSHSSGYFLDQFRHLSEMSRSLMELARGGPNPTLFELNPRWSQLDKYQQRKAFSYYRPISECNQPGFHLRDLPADWKDGLEKYGREFRKAELDAWLHDPTVSEKERSWRMTIHVEGGNPALQDVTYNDVSLVYGIGSLTRIAVRGIASSAAAARSGAPNIVRYGPHMKGPLPESVANTFRGGSYAQKTLECEQTLWRVHGGKAGELGSYWSRTPPQGPLQVRMDLALKPEWGNTATSVSRITVPKGTVIFEGAAAPQGNLLGGGSQVYIPNVNPLWLVKP